MRKPFVVALCLPLMFLSCPDPSGGPEEVRIAVPRDFMGMVHAGSRSVDEPSDKDAEYASLNELGVQWMLTDFSWSTIQPSKDTWNWTRFDAYVENGKSNGKKILALLDYDVNWLHDGTHSDDPYNNMDGNSENNTPAPYISPAEIPLFCEYVKKTVGRYQDRVDAWCVWNEPNLSDRFWAGTKEEFFELTKQAAAAIREVDPDAFIIGGAFNTLAGDEWVRGIFESGAMERIDAVAYHPYMPDAGSSAYVYERFKKTVAPYGFDGKVWVTEAGYPTRGSYGTEVSDKEMPETLVKTISLLAAGGANRVFWYHFLDPKPENQDEDDSEDWFGLLNYDFSRKNGADAAYTLCGAHIPGKTYRSSLPGRSGIPDYITARYFEGDEGNTLIIWNERPSKTVQLKVRLPGRAQKSCDVATGESSPADEETLIRFAPDNGKGLYFFTWESAGLTSPPWISAP
ncbi:MAG: beta-galactosidase [Treponema sp.]|jgi:hypothetical protein|nr:beta-galactosidase [Treponema sp.]